MKQKVYNFIHENKYFIRFIYALIVANLISIILESYQELRKDVGPFFYYFELFSVVVFSIEYILRLWTADLNTKFSGNAFTKRIKWVFSPMAIIDLLAVLPFYLPLFIVFDLRYMRILRLFRLLRIFKLARISKSLKTISDVLKETKSELTITVMMAAILLILSSSLMYQIENTAQPEKFANIGQALWWAVATLTTVGYGDVYPITAWGKLLGAFIAIIGIGFVALPTGIISSAFIDKIQESKKHKAAENCICPHCGTEVAPNNKQ